ncbi:hypothetical protein ACMFMF_009366 [Clarireedia jacksonii]
MRTRLADIIYGSERNSRTRRPANSRTRLLENENWYTLSTQTDGENRRQAILALTFFASFVCVCVVAYWFGHWNALGDTTCPRYVSEYSPILDDIKVEYKTTTFNSSLLQLNSYRAEAGLEVDAAWDELGVNYRSIVISKAVAAKSGIRCDHLKMTDAFEGGYLANVEGLQHLQCLNLLRKGLWYNYNYYAEQKQGSFADEIEILKMHVSQCLDILRQQLMCMVDTGLVGQIPPHSKESHPSFDFNTKHKCKNFNAVKSWARDRQLAEEATSVFLDPPR